MALGVENLKKALGLVLHLVDKIEEVTQDGWQWLKDSLALLPTLTEVPGVIKNGRAIWDEVQDLDDDERAELNAFAKQELDLEDEKVEAVVEAAFDVLDAVGDLVDKIKDAKKPE
jgi:hypothetical protein